ncbi:hypothetical protein HP550_08275 [Cellulomonas humilata]|uniref:Uncharacterized protein n=1 Tax=Cellulomonas humilata TaxID=144055 RepID=A0A7Y5ZZY7_9CELL|nr:hypothetical protein [Cellulomonas humilata]NUU17246.1 hypothetical protein [Cellulomonas humilata]
MRSSTIGLIVTGTLVVASGATVIALLARDDPGTNPARWKTETLTADGASALPNPLHVALADCPGFSLSSPVPQDSRNAPGAGTYMVRLAPEHTALWVCTGTVEETGGARAAVAVQLADRESMTSMNPALVTTPFGEVVRVDRAFGPDAVPRLTDWLVDHGGYTYAFGYLHPTQDARYYEDMEAMIASIVWDE